MRNEDRGKILGVKRENVKIDSLKMCRSQKVMIKCEYNLLKIEDSETGTPWYPLPPPTDRTESQSSASASCALQF